MYFRQDGSSHDPYHHNSGMLEPDSADDGQSGMYSGGKGSSGAEEHKGGSLPPSQRNAPRSHNSTNEDRSQYGFDEKGIAAYVDEQVERIFGGIAFG